MALWKIDKCISCNGVSHEWEFGAPRLKEMRHIQSRTGMRLNAFMEAMDDWDAEALTALVDVLHRRAGIILRWEDIDLDLESLTAENTPEEIVEAERLSKELAATVESSRTSGVAPTAEFALRSVATPPTSGESSESPSSLSGT